MRWFFDNLHPFRRIEGRKARAIFGPLMGVPGIRFSRESLAPRSVWCPGVACDRAPQAVRVACRAALLDDSVFDDSFRLRCDQGKVTGAVELPAVLNYAAVRKGKRTGRTRIPRVPMP